MTTTTDYRTTIRVNASPDVLFDAVTTTEGLTAWWNPVTGSGETGGELRFPMNAPPTTRRARRRGNPPNLGALDRHRVRLHDRLDRNTSRVHHHTAERRVMRSAVRAPRPERRSRMQGNVQP